MPKKKKSQRKCYSIWRTTRLQRTYELIFKLRQGAFSKQESLIHLKWLNTGIHCFICASNFTSMYRLEVHLREYVKAARIIGEADLWHEISIDKRITKEGRETGTPWEFTHGKVTCSCWGGHRSKLHEGNWTPIHQEGCFSHVNKPV